MIARSRLGSSLLLALAVGCGWNTAGGDDDGVEVDAGEGRDAAPEPEVPPEVDGQLVINELMADNALTYHDEVGGAGDWIEIYNPTDVDIPLFGYGVTDQLASPHRAVLPAGLVAPAGGYLLLWLDDQAERGPDHLRIRLAREAGAVGLSRPDRSYIDRLVYGPQAVDFSASRAPDGSDAWRIEWHASPGAANPAGSGGAVAREDEDEPPEKVPGVGDLSERILGDDVMPAFEILISQDNMAALEAQPFVYVPATLVYDDRSYGPVGLRLKGQNSFLPLSEKAAFRINIDEYVGGAKFFGLDDLTFNNMSTDYSMMHDRAAYWVARRLGLPASRANHALLTLNGAFYGLFSNVETVKRRMIARWFDDPDGALFEATDVDFVAADVDDFELEDGIEDRTLLSQSAAALDTGTPSQAIAAVSQFLDVTQFQRFWGMCAVIGQFDSFPYSNPGDDYFVYADPSAGKLAVIPWGMDETFYAGSLDVHLVHSILATTCMGAPACYDGFVDSAWAILDATEEMDLVGRLDHIRAQIAPFVAQDTRKPYSDQTVSDFQTSMRQFVTDRPAKLEAMLPPAE